MACFCQLLVLTAKCFKKGNEQTWFIEDNHTPQKFVCDDFSMFLKTAPKGKRQNLTVIYILSRYN